MLLWVGRVGVLLFGVFLFLLQNVFRKHEPAAAQSGAGKAQEPATSRLLGWDRKPCCETLGLFTTSPIQKP